MDEKGKKPLKAYKDFTFLNSSAARSLRIIAEFLEPENRFDYYNVKHTIVFFGSARTKPLAESQKYLKNLEDAISTQEHVTDETRASLEDARSQIEMSKYYEDAVELSKLITEWSISGRQYQKFFVSSGGGPGIMEAANKGAKLAGGKSIGLNISLPFEQYPNPYITDELNFEFHYFFMRKYWFAYLAKALIVFPGGYGTLDELMEILTLVQTRKISKPIIIIVYGKDYWNSIINFDGLIKTGMISREDLDLFRFADTPMDAFNYLKTELAKRLID